MFRRDEKRLQIAEKYGAHELYVSTDTGRVLGYVTCSSTKWFKRVIDFAFAVTLTIEEYLWMTDETRDRTVTTAADLYDRIEWTQSGFLIDGHRMKYQKSELFHANGS